jgi:hypothetical protein
MPPRSEAPVRKTRAQLSTATARAEVRDTAAPQYDPFEAAAPLQPTTYMSTSVFKYDDFVGQRRYARRHIHGETDNRFDADEHPAPASYRARLEAQPLTSYVDEDALIEDERAAALVDQPAEAIAALRNDLNNARFIDAIRGPVTRSAAPSTELARQRELAHAATKNARAVEAAFTEARDQDPDFFTRLSGYELIRRRMQHHKASDAALIAAIDNELDTLATRAQDDDDDIEAQRASLERERRELATADDDNPPDDDDETQIATIGVVEARQLLEKNPLVMLHKSMRIHFLQLAEAALVWHLLTPLTLQHEEHRAHYNVVELVRAMALRGAKYDGCIKVRTRHRLGALLDAEFFAPFLDDSAALIGGHEHWSGHYTTLVVLKFYLVRRNKLNTEVLADKSAPLAGAPSELTDEATTNIDNHFDLHKRHMVLNKAGLYDADTARTDDDTDDGTDEYGSMHDIRHLEREFMFSLRVVCAEAGDEQEDAVAGYASLDDNDYVLPREAVPAEPAALASVWSINNNRSSDRPSSGTRNSSRPSDGASRPERDDDIEPANEDAAAFVHSDDDDSLEGEAHARAAAHMKFMPADRLVLTLEQAQHLVGKWRAPAFLQRINSQSVGQLCVRAFMFYATGVGK